MDVKLTEFGTESEFCGAAFSGDTNKWYVGSGLGEITSLEADGDTWPVLDDDAVTAIAISPNGKELLFGTSNELICRSINDEKVKFSVRSPLPIRQAEYDASGSHIFFCSEENDVKVHSITTQALEITIRSNDQAVRGLALDSKGDYLALVNGAGDLFVYQLVSQKGPLGKQFTGSNMVCLKSGVLPPGVCRDYNLGFSLSFTRFQDKLLLAVPQIDGSPMVLQRHIEHTDSSNKQVKETWTEIGPLATDEYETVLTHSGRHVNIVAFSPNGQYLASADVTGRVLLWDMSRQDVVCAVSAGVALVAVKWGVLDGDNYLMLLSRNGWAKVDEIIKVHTGLGLPTGQVKAIEHKQSSPVSMKETSRPASSGPPPPAATAEASMKGQGDSVKRFRKMSSEGQGAHATSDDEDEFEFSAGVEEVKSKLQTSAGSTLLDREAASGNILHDDSDDDDMDDDGVVEDGYTGTQLYDSQTVGGIPQFLQEPFQPSATTPDEKKRRYMVWNAIGTIISREDGVGNRVEIKFADMSSSNKQESFADNYGFTMADMSHYGAIFAAPPDEPEPEHILEDGMPPPPKTTGSVVFYRSFGNKMMIGGGNENFTHTLSPGEEAVAVCAGSGWCAVATSKSYLRVFSSTGLQISITLLKGPVVCLCGYDTCLAVVYNSSGCTVDTPILLVDQYDISPRRPLQAITACTLPLSSRGTLAWAAFSEDRYLMALDSNGVLCALLSSMGWQWVPVMDTSVLCRTVDHKVWPVVVKAERFCYALLHGERKPVVFPQPVVSARPFKLPLIESKDKVECERTRELLWSSMQLGHNEALKNHSLFVGGDAVCGKSLADIEEDTYSLQLDRDKLLIRHFHDCLKKQRVAGAIDVMSRISTTEGLANAIKVANALGKAALAKLLSDLLAEKESENVSGDAGPTAAATQSSQMPVNPVVSSYTPSTEEDHTYNYSMSQSQTQTSNYTPSSGYNEMKSTQSPPHARNDGEDREGVSRLGGSVLTGAKRRGPKGHGGAAADDVHMPVNRFAQSSIVSPHKKRRDAYESMQELKGSPSPKKPLLQVKG